MIHTYSVQLIICLLGFTLGNNVEFNVNPKMLEPMVTETLTLTCGYNTSTTVSPGPTDITKLVSISVSKDGQDLATVTQFSPLKPTSIGNQSDFELTGEVVGNSGHIHMTNRYPMGSQSGSYQCLVAGIDSHGHPHTLSQIIQVNADEVTYQDMISEIRHLKMEKEEIEHSQNQSNQLLFDKINDLISTNTLQNSSISAISRNLSAQNSLINSLTATNTRQDSSITTLRNNVTGLEQKVSTIDSALNAKVYFTAWLSTPSSGSSDILVTKGSTVIYDKTFSNYGNVYNTTSGQFVCSRSGVYLFIVDITNAGNKSAALRINYNGGTGGYGRMIADDQYGYSSSSASVVLTLNKGDTVQVKADYDSRLYGSDHNTFTGVLLYVW